MCLEEIFKAAKAALKVHPLPHWGWAHKLVFGSPLKTPEDYLKIRQKTLGGKWHFGLKPKKFPGCAGRWWAKAHNATCIGGGQNPLQLKFVGGVGRLGGWPCNWLFDPLGLP